MLSLTDDIEVVFYEIDSNTGKKSWEAQGLFAPTDVHRQVVFTDVFFIFIVSLVFLVQAPFLRWLVFAN